MMANLLFWLGEDRIIWGTDFPIWYPHWILDEFMEFQIPEETASEFGVQLTPEIKEKIVGTNFARLYGIDIEKKKAAIANDEFSQKRAQFLANQASYVGA
jgi:predicted TIM-barrel fold metal-dependent hydrolase